MVNSLIRQYFPRKLYGKVSAGVSTVSVGISGHLKFNSSFLNEAKADLIASHAQDRTLYWLPIAKVFSS